jgi:hypothetical protein
MSDVHETGAGSARYSQLLVSVPFALLSNSAGITLAALTGSHVARKLPHIYGTQRFITVFIGAHHLSLSEPDETNLRPHILFL